MNYQNKYLKYKNKYIKLKNNQFGGKIPKCTDLTNHGYVENILSADIDVTTYLDNNIYFTKTSNTTIDDVNSRKLYTLLKAIKERKNDVILDSNRKFNDTLFKLDKTYEYSHTYKFKYTYNKHTPPEVITKCSDVHISKQGEYDTRTLKIMKDGSKYKLYSDTNQQILEDNNILNLIITFTIDSAYSKGDYRCRLFRTESTPKYHLDINHLKKDDDDVILIQKDLCIIKSRDILVYNDDIYILKNYDLDANGEISNFEFFPRTDRMHNFNNDYKDSIKALFTNITNNISAYLATIGEDPILNQILNFYHIHVSDVKDEPNKLCFVIHSDAEDAGTGQKYMLDGQLLTQKPYHSFNKKIGIRHNHLVIVELDDGAQKINLTTYSLKNKFSIDILNDMFTYMGEKDTMNTSFLYNMFGRHICDINYHEGGVPLIAFSKPSNLPVNNPKFGFDF